MHCLTYGQRALWFEQQVSPASAAYNFFVPLRVRGKLDPERLYAVFQALSARHASLRAAFAEIGDEVALRIREQPALDFKQIDARRWSEQRTLEELSLEAHRPFDLRRGPLFRVRLWVRSGSQAFLLLCLHHGVVDFASLLILLAEARELYAGRELPQVASEFTDYARWQARMIESPRGEAQWRFWRRLLAGEWPALELPLDFQRPNRATCRGASQSVGLSRALTGKLGEAAAAHRVTPRDLLLTAFQVLLHRWSGQDRLVIGSPFACRTQAEFEGTVGYLANPLALPSEVSDSSRLGDCLTQTARTVNEASGHQHYPFPLLVERLKPARSAARSPLFQTLFAFYGSDLYPMLSLLSDRTGLTVEFDDLRLDPLPIDHRAAIFDLSLIVLMEEAGQARAQLQYRTDLFRPRTITSALARYEEILDQLVRRPETPVRERRAPRGSRPATGLTFSLFYFADGGESRQGGKYRLLLEGARFADRAGLAAVWTPERHFHRFGGLYPNPAVTAAAIAAITERVRIRAGSVVLPLHHPVRVAEEWSMVDNLSNGRAEISLASGWSARDFILAPDNYADRRARIAPTIELLRGLWRGESHGFPGPTGEMVNLTVLPRPVQLELPIWISAFGNPDTFRLAGSLGAGVLTHLIGQTVEALTDKIALYRRTLAESGVDPSAARVAVMLHTFLCADADLALETVRRPFLAYLKSCAELGQDEALRLGIDLTDRTVDSYLLAAFARYCRSSALFGTIETCMPLLDRLEAAGVNEIACLIDFGVDEALVLSSLPLVAELQRRRLPSVASGTAANAGPVHSAAGGVERAATRRRQLGARLGRARS